MPIRILHSPQPVPSTCFFCGTKPIKPLKDPRTFKCSECRCWNRYDENGEIMSDEPAMHDESLNATSFAKRASPSKSRFPTKNAQSLFCRTCLTNQTLLVSLLSNYLPDSHDPSYESSLADLPEYKKALEARYPPVCKDCEFSVDEAIKSKEHMARTSALGSWLQKSRIAGSNRSIEQQTARRAITMWRIRGLLWVVTIVLFICIYIAGGRGFDLYNFWMAVVLPPWSLLSVFWTFWDPTWSTVRVSQLQGRSFSATGRQLYIYCQTISWIIRLFTSSMLSLQHFNRLHDLLTPSLIQTLYISALIAELFLGIIWITNLRIKRPPRIRLLDSGSLSDSASKATSPAPAPAPAQPLLAESLLANFSITPKSDVPPKHVFGKSSFPSPISQPDVAPEDMMDWTPVKPQEDKQAKDVWLRPQKFFPPEQPTGLEDLFQKAIKLDHDTSDDHVWRKALKWKRCRQCFQDYKLHITMLLAGAIITLVLGLGYVYLRRHFMPRTNVIYVQLDDL